MELKFRVWDKWHKCMEYIGDYLYWFEENGVRNPSGGGHTGDYDIMLFTGLKTIGDGKEVYEGDYIKRYKNGNFWVVVFENGVFYGKPVGHPNPIKVLLSTLIANGAFLAGNIYETVLEHDETCF